MSHSLHRAGSSASLAGDYVVLAKAAKGFSDAGAAPRLRAFLENARAHGAVNAGHGRGGSLFCAEWDAVLEAVTDTATVTVAFDAADRVLAFLGAVRDLDTGLSITLTTLFDESRALCRRLGLEPYAAKHAAGLYGRTERLPDPTTLEITTMCGHGLVAAGLVRRAVDEVRAGKWSVREAVAELARPCVCGIVNPTRATGLLEELLERALAAGEGAAGRAGRARDAGRVAVPGGGPRRNTGSSRT